MDLKNAFGEVPPNLIYEVLKYHHIPEHVENLIKDLYTDFQTSIITEQFHTPFINVGRGVLQGDCLSPLLFNMTFNTFIQHIKSEKFRQLGFLKVSENGMRLNPTHCSSLRMTQLLLLARRRKINYSLIVSQFGVSGPI